MPERATFDPRVSQLGVEDRPGRILVVEDQPLDRDLIVRVLERGGHWVKAAASSEEALKLLENERPELILCDICMPGMDGLEFCRSVKTKLGEEFVPFLFVTALKKPEHLLAGFEAGAEDYIEKPFDFDELLARVRTMLRIRRLHVALREQARQLKEAHDEMEELLRVVSHDLRAPLLSIVAAADELLRVVESGDLRREAIEPLLVSLRSAAVHSAELANQIVEYGRLGRGTQHWMRFSLQLAVEQACRNVKAQLDQAGAQLHVAEHWPEVYGDPVAICQVVQNLVDNACKFADPSRQLVIEIGWCPDGDGYRIWVKDSGRGIPREKQEGVFRLFYRAASDQPGYGVGLAAAQRIVQRHGGRMGLESEPGVGTTVWFWLPRSEDRG